MSGIATSGSLLDAAFAMAMPRHLGAHVAFDRSERALKKPEICCELPVSIWFFEGVTHPSGHPTSSGSKKHMRKNWLFLAGSLTGVCLTLLVTGPEGEHLVARARAAAGVADTYSQLNLFGAVFERVRADYVEKPSDEALIEGAINGMVTSLDPHSRYMNDKA